MDSSASPAAILHELQRPAPSRFGAVLFDHVRLDVGPDWLVKGVLPAGGFAVVFGESGSGKSFFAADLATHIALGWSWHGKKTQQGGIVYVAAEGGASMRKRLAGFRQFHEGKLSRDVPFALLPTGINLLDPAADLPTLLDEVNSLTKSIGSIKLIVIDTLSRVLAGGNENGSDDMGAFVANIDRLRAETGAGALVVHHTGKDGTKGARGHSLLRAAVDTEIEVVRDRGRGPDEARLSSARITKQRDGQDGAEFGFRLEQMSLGTDCDGEPITTCIVREMDGPVRPAKQVPGSAQATLEALRRALADFGQAPPSDTDRHIPAGQRVCQEARWRECALAARIADTDNPDSKARAFNRALTRLQQVGLIGIWKDWVWLVDKPDTGGQGPDKLVTAPLRDPTDTDTPL